MIQNAVEQKIIDFLKTKEKGASSSDIANKIGHNRITVTKYLEVMKVSGKLECEDMAQAKIWTLKGTNGKKKILIVDDEKYVVDLIALSLPDSDYEVQKAYSGLEAMDLVHRKKPDLIILDIMMPTIDGYEVCERIKSNPEFKSIPIIMLSAKFQKEDRIKGINAGAEHYMVKPFDPIELEAKVKSILRRIKDDIDCHSLTGLPGAKTLDNNIKDRLKILLNNTAKKIFISKFTIKNFSNLRNNIGFKKSEDVMILISRTFLESTKEKPLIAYHVTDETMILVSEALENGQTDKLCEEIKDTLIKKVFSLFEFIFHDSKYNIESIIVENIFISNNNYNYERSEYVKSKKPIEISRLDKKMKKVDIERIIASDFSLDDIVGLKEK